MTAREGERAGATTRPSGRLSARRIGGWSCATGICCARLAAPAELIYGAVQMLMWGFLQTYIDRSVGSSPAPAERSSARS